MGDEEGDSVQVAVRMRIFNGREKGANAERIVRMENLDKGSKTYVMDPDTREERHFNYDYSFQSHSDSEPGIGEWATQDTVMQTLGIPVLNAALEGRNVSLFAYGQTGAGKSFSMLGKVGVHELEGIIPRSCKDIFRRIAEETNPLVTTTVDIQVVEVYCEMINDLLADRKVWPANGHKPRLTPKHGYVVDTITKPCLVVDDIWGCMEFADKNRSVGSHALNPESSRAHTIYQINYCKMTKNEEGKVLETVTAKLNLIDLAGSERTDSAGTAGQMLKEGNAINLSLTALGGCIKSLSEGKKPNFRDSKLTLLLQASMTSGKVIMIAALSPASICYPETLSTLKFADRIKQVKIKSSKNVSADPVAEIKKAMEEMRNKMQEEIDALKAGGAVAAPSGGEGGDSELEAMLAEQAEAEARMKEELEAQIRALEETTGDRQARADAITSEQEEVFGPLGRADKSAETRPFLVNLHEDDMLAETLLYAFDTGDSVIGRKNPDAPPKLEFSGMGMSKDHCTITVEGEEEGQEKNRTYIMANNNSRTHVNGKKLDSDVKTELFHNNRLWLGNNYAFRFHCPGREAQGEQLSSPPNYEMAQIEMGGGPAAAEDGDDEDGLALELRHRLKEAEKKVDQANIIAMDLGRDVVFQPKIYENRASKTSDVVAHVQMGSLLNFTWPWEKFTVRLTDMVQMWSEWQAAEAKGEELPAREPGDDPFVDMEDQLIGEADVWLNALANMVEFSAETTILSIFGQLNGKLSLELNPCDRNGNTGPWEDDDDDLDPFVDNAEDLMDTDINFEIKITEVKLDEANTTAANGVCRYEKCYVRYKFNPNDDDEPWTKTGIDLNDDQDFHCIWNFTSKHKVHVDKDVLQQITKGKICFQLWGSLNERALSTARPGTAAAADRLQAKQAELEALELRIKGLQGEVASKNQQIADRNKQIMDLDRQIAAKGS